MHLSIIARVLGVMLSVFSITLLPPAVLSFFYSDGMVSIFLTTCLITFLSGLLFWAPFYNRREPLQARDGFVITALFWFVLSLFGSLPFLLFESSHIHFTDAFFEALSGLTATGATVLTGLEDLPRSLLFYRQQLQWLGGMGIIVLAIAILPVLGLKVGGMQLFRAETPGPVKDSKLTPRIAQTAKALWSIYLLLTLLCALSYWLAGMDVFDAVCHSFSTVSIGGFSTHDASIGYFDSYLIENIAIFFILISAFNFALHFYTFRHVALKHYWQDAEVRFLIKILLAAVAVVVAVLLFHSVYGPEAALRYGLFEVVSLMTTAGFSTVDPSSWPIFLPLLLFLLSFIGGCSGSTGGGIKVIRVLLIAKQGLREIGRLIHPNAIYQIKLRDKIVSDSVIDVVWGFLSLYVLVYVTLMLLLMATNLDFLTSFSAVGAALNNLGPGLGEVSEHYRDINLFAKWVLCVAMLLGRLEIFTVIVLITPTFWRN